MSAIRLIPIEDDAAFPTLAAFNILESFDGMKLRKAKFAKMIKAGKRFGWTDERIKAHQELEARGRCYNFEQDLPPHLRGTLYEDNIFFSFIDGEHEDECKPIIEEMAKQLNVRIKYY